MQHLTSSHSVFYSMQHHNSLLSILHTPQFAQQHPVLANKLQKLLSVVDRNEPNRVIRLAKRLCERCIKETLLLTQSGKDVRIWNVLKERGCEYLPDGNQDHVIRSLISVFSQVPRPRLARSDVTSRVLAHLNSQGFLTMQPNYWSPPSIGSSFRFSKTKVGHVLHLLSNGDAFTINRDQQAMKTWQLREELLDFDELRRINDGTIVAMAQEEGIFLSPSVWSRYLYHDLGKTAHFQSILDRQKLQLDSLLDLLRKRNVDMFVRFDCDAMQSLSRLAAIPNAVDHAVSLQEVHFALQAVYSTLLIRLEVQNGSGQAPRLGLVSPCSSVSSGPLEERAWFDRSCFSPLANSPIVRPWLAQPSPGPIGSRPATCNSRLQLGSLFEPIRLDCSAQRHFSTSSSTTSASTSVFQFSEMPQSSLQRLFVPSNSQPVSPASFANDPAAASPSPARPIRGRGAASSDSLSDEFVHDAYQTPGQQLCHWLPFKPHQTRAAQQSQSCTTPSDDSFDKQTDCMVPPAATNCSPVVPACQAEPVEFYPCKMRKSRRSSSACDLTANSEYDEFADDVFPAAYFTLNCLANSSVLLDTSPPSPAAVAQTKTATAFPLYLRTLSEAAKDDLSH